MIQTTVPRLVIAAPSSGSGKSTLTTGLMAALSEEYTVQGFKAGPDYIDPTYHTAATGHPSHNLDTWMLPHDRVKQSFVSATQGADIALIEGVMGLYDGYDALTERGSTAELAKLINAPVVLVLDVRAMARSAGAIAQGLRDFDPDLNVCGVICNRVGSGTHAQWVTQAVESVGLPVLGCLPREAELHIPERHLGLHTAIEREAEVRAFINRAAELVRQYIDLERLWDVARQAGTVQAAPVEPAQRMHDANRVRVAVAYDEAFCFYYHANFEYLRAAGADVVFFSPMRDTALPPDIAGVYLGGGYPELYAAQLTQNTSMMNALGAAIQQNMPVYAECGGLMVLTESITDTNGTRHEMLGVVPGHTVMRDRVRLGYREVTTTQDTVILPAGESVRGHEFHYSEWVGRDDTQPAPYTVHRRNSEDTWPEGIMRGNVLASYIHLHFGANPRIAPHFVEQCRTWQQSVVV